MSRPSDRKADRPAVGRPEQLAVVHAGKELTAATAADLRAAVADVLAGRPRTGATLADNPNVEEEPAVTAEMRFLLSGVSTFDQNGLGLLVGLQREARSVGVRLVCVNPSTELFAALRQQGLQRVLTVELDVRE
jgi:anti-anti-sigma regulatory factor